MSAEWQLIAGRSLTSDASQGRTVSVTRFAEAARLAVTGVTSSRTPGPDTRRNEVRCVCEPAQLDAAYFVELTLSAGVTGVSDSCCSTGKANTSAMPLRKCSRQAHARHVLDRTSGYFTLPQLGPSHFELHEPSTFIV